VLSRNITPILPLFPLKISEKTDHKEPPSRRKSSRKRFSKNGIETNSGPEETQPDINTQPTKTDNNTEDECDEFFMENVNSDMEIRTIDLYFSFIESPQETNIQNNSESESEDESVSKELNLDKTEQAYPNINNIAEIRNNLL